MDTLGFLEPLALGGYEVFLDYVAMRDLKVKRDILDIMARMVPLVQLGMMVNLDYQVFLAQLGIEKVVLNLMELTLAL